MKHLALLLLSLTLYAGEKRVVPPPFSVFNCKPKGQECKRVEWPEAHAYYLFNELLSEFQLRGFKLQLINPRLELGDPSLEGNVEYTTSFREPDKSVIRETVRMKEWSDAGFALGWAHLLNKKIPVPLSDSELDKIVISAVISARVKVSPEQLRSEH